MAEKTKTKTKTKVKKTKKKDYTYAVGRRKTATARVRLYSKKGDLIVNGVPAGQYFPSERSKAAYLQPLKVTNTLGKLSFSVKVQGSGKYGQLGAVVHGISRALAILDEETHRPVLKKYGLLTRDSRMRETRKAGTGGKARRKKQSPKR
ncbi:30S ribosomal protein S9 [Patescibacteria group bacterium]